MNPGADSQQPTKRGRRALTAAALTAALTLAALLRLTAAGDLAATGTRIAALEEQRESLRLRRARALAEHVAVTDPARLEARALAMGFGPPDHIEFFVADPAILGMAPDIGPRSPLGMLTISERALTPTQPDAPSVAERILAGFARPASAQGSSDPLGGLP
jgi:hypothetical protein